jgi:sulfate adenylyltransferase
LVSTPHGGRLIQLEVSSLDRDSSREATENPSISIHDENVITVGNISNGILSPLEGFMCEADYRSVIDSMRLADDMPWTIPILLNVPESAKIAEKDEVTLLGPGMRPAAVVEVEEVFRISKKEYAQKVFGTEDMAHPGVAKLQESSGLVAGGPLKKVFPRETNFDDITLSPMETRVLFQEKGWKDVIAFQTRNAPHIGHEYVQKMALLAADGLFINPVLGRKKPGDFKDEVIVGAYKVLVKGYYPKNSAVMSVLHYEMQYAGPKEAIMHAIMRKNFGCTKIAIGRDHAGVGNYYGPYAAHEIFKEFPDLAIEPVLMREFYYCNKCGGIANELICPHPESDRLTFSGTMLRKMFQSGQAPPKEFMRPEVARVILDHSAPFVE